MSASLMFSQFDVYFLFITGTDGRKERGTIYRARMAENDMPFDGSARH